MLRGCRFIILAVAGLILIGANQPSEHSASDPPAAQSHKNTDQKKDIAFGVSRIGEALEANNAKADPYEKERNEREIRDLQAQENSAYWAESMFWATVAALILSFIGIGLVWTTFHETKETNKIAKDAQRPWLVHKITSAKVSINQDGLELWASYVVQNVGQSLACSVNVECDAFLVADSGDAFLQFDDWHDDAVCKAKDCLASIGPNTIEEFSMIRKFTPEECAVFGANFAILIPIAVCFKTKKPNTIWECATRAVTVTPEPENGFNILKAIDSGNSKFDNPVIQNFTRAMRSFYFTDQGKKN